MQLNDFKVPGKQLIVKGSMELRSEDIAGETSGTEVAEKGIKPKVLRVSLVIPFKQATALRDLIKVSEAKDNKGVQTVYTITDRTANATGVRQVRFIEQFTWEEADTLQQWNVSFTLQEHMSNPERLEKRTETVPGTAPSKDHSKVAQQIETL